MTRPRWNDREAAELTGALPLLAYRSRLLAADRSVCNIYGGNTSSKSMERDHLGREVRVLWVKGSGSDMADCSERAFAGLKLDEVMPLLDREELSDEQMVAYLDRCAFEPGRPRQSIETLLHAFCPHPEVDHTHPDAILALACTARGEAAAREVFGERMVWVDYVRPGFELSKRIAMRLQENRDAECVVMGKHGLVTWGATSKECYERTVAIIEEAEGAVREANKRVWAGGGADLDLPAKEWLPALRGALCANRRYVLQTDRSPRAREMVDTPDAKRLSAIGAACPDHLVHTRRVPLWLDLRGERDAPSAVREGVSRYRTEYEAYFRRHAHSGEEMFDPIPRVVLVPGYGIVTAGSDSAQADVSRQLYHRAIEVIEGAEVIGGFESLTEGEAFGIEYWPLELYKLTLRPSPRELDGWIACVTGGGSGIGRATCRALHARGAHVVVADLDESAAVGVAGDLGDGRAIGIRCDVTNEASVEQMVARCVEQWGGLDVLVCSAGIATSAPIEEVSVEDWTRNFDVLTLGCFLPTRAAFKVWRAQGVGGSLVAVTSKNALVAGRNASAYSAAKAAAQHFTRCMAEEGGAIGVRANCVLPDAVLEGSAIWDSAWREERAKSYAITPEELEEFYRQRNALRVNVLPEDVAEAIVFLAGPRSGKTTGCSMTVDGGISAAYPR